LTEGADVNVTDETTMGRLFHAVVAGGCVALTRSMLADGADIELKTDNSDTPLHVAAIMNQRAVAELLIKKGARLEVRKVNGDSPLDHAVRNGHEEFTRLLVEKGASVDEKVLALARRSLSEEMVEWLRSRSDS
jgi:ankyrin repeat protein